MRKAFPTSIAAICVLGIAFALHGRGLGSSPEGRPGSSFGEAPVTGNASGRFRIAVVGSRGPQRFGTAFRIDTATGRAWRAIVRQGLNEGWSEIAETEGKGPEASESSGRYDLSADLISDKLGQEAGIAGRIDTRTGRGWFLQPLPDAPRWIPIEEASKGSGE